MDFSFLSLFLQFLASLVGYISPLLVVFCFIVLFCWTFSGLRRF